MGWSAVMSYIEVKDACKKYFQNGTETTVLDHVSLDIEKGEFICLLGPSGCGKSTLLNALAGFEKVNSGSVKINNNEVTEPSEKNITIFQNYGLLPWRNVLKNVELGLETKKLPKEERQKIAEKYIELVGLKGYEKRHPKQLSGGQQQRVAIARALVNDPVILLADEATGNLDTRTSYEIMEIFQELNSRGKTIVFVTHEPDIATFSSRTIVLRDGQIKRDTPNGDVQNAHEAFMALPPPETFDDEDESV